MGVRIVRPSASGTRGIRLWRSPSWPIGSAPDDALAVEWCGRPGEPASYALLGVQAGGTASPESHAGEPFSESLVGRYDQIEFGLTPAYRDAASGVLGDATTASVCIGAHGRLGSSEVAFWAVAMFIRDFDEELWELPDDEVWEAWSRSFAAAMLRAEQSRLQRQMDLHRRSPFPPSVDRGAGYGEIEPVMADADIYGWAAQVASGVALQEPDVRRLEDLRSQVNRSIGAFPTDAREYFREVERIGSAALSVNRYLAGEGAD